jgi:cyclopropane fatty-acyl-phospholipid synthase-like methyltransferase
MQADIYYKEGKSKILRDIHRKVFGDDFPEEVDSDSFVTKTDLHNIIRHLDIGPGRTVFDIGCGRGGPGMWIAREIGANYVGIDISENAVKFARQRVKEFGLHNKASFHVGDICTIDLSGAQYDAAISIDVLMFIPKITTAMKKVAQVLRSGSIFAFTAWEDHSPNKYNDFRPFLEKTGFTVKVYEETPDWESRQRKVYQFIIDSKKELIEDMDTPGTISWIHEAEFVLPTLKDKRRIFAVARKS